MLRLALSFALLSPQALRLVDDAGARLVGDVVLKALGQRLANQGVAVGDEQDLAPGWPA